MNKDSVDSEGTQPQIYIGMSFDEVCNALGGPPDNTTQGSKLFGGKGKVTGFFTSPTGPAEMHSRAFFTKYCMWRRPEGDYYLNFVHDVLESVTGAPEGAIVERPESNKTSLPARFVQIFTDGGSDNPGDVLNAMVREGELIIHPDALIYGDVDVKMAVDLPLESILTRGLAKAITALNKAGKEEYFLDLDTCTVNRFRKARGPGSAGVIVTIAGPSNDPDSYRYVEFKKKRRDVCGKCGITEEDRLKQWNAPAPRGTVKIGSGRGAFMYCEKCETGICGRCSVDLGMSAGCPVCRTELVYMDGGKQ